MGRYTQESEFLLDEVRYYVRERRLVEEPWIGVEVSNAIKRALQRPLHNTSCVYRITQKVVAVILQLIFIFMLSFKDTFKFKYYYI